MKYSLTEAIQKINSARYQAIRMADQAQFAGDRLFHYTNADGLDGIFRSKQLWCTDYQFLDDPSEFNYAKEVLKDCLKRHDEHLSKIFFEQEKFILRVAPHYVASLCEDGDLLDMWRGYTQIPGGFSLGFSHNNLKEHSSPFTYMIDNVIYSRADQHSILDTVLDACQEAYRGVTERDKANLVETIEGSALRFLYRFKNPCWSRQREWRLVASTKWRKEEFRAVKGRRVPYIRLPIKTDSLELIIQGPGPSRAVDESTVEQMARERGFAKATVALSNVPYLTAISPDPGCPQRC
jgi:hypothetical protein